MPTHFVLPLAIWALVVLALPALPADAAETPEQADEPMSEGSRLPIPADELIRAATAQIKDIFKAEIAAATKTKSKLKLAENLFEQAQQTSDDPPSRYALCLESQRLACEAPDPLQALRVADFLVETFEVDEAEILSKTFRRLAKSTNGGSAQRQLVQALSERIDQAMAAQQGTLAEKLASLAESLGTNIKDGELRKGLAARVAAVIEWQREELEAQQAAQSLSHDPEDPVANAKFGRHLCLLRGDWQRGLPLMAKGDHKALSVAAALDQAQPAEPLKMAAVADAWWDLAQSEKGLARTALLARAVSWYERALGGLSGLQKVKAEKRLHEASADVKVAGKVAAPDGASQSKASKSSKAVTKTLDLPLAENVLLRMRLIPAGRFIMGSPATDKYHGPWHTQHEVTISKAFYLGVTEVTREQWAAVYGRMPGPWPNDPGNFPAGSISWNEIQDFIQKLNEPLAKRKIRLRLPTSAEWEYACRAGTTTRYYFGDDPGRLQEFEWFRDNDTTHHVRAVGGLKPNPWGLFDMCGNITEWCADGFPEKGLSSSAATDPVEPVVDRIVLRGGGTGADAIWCQVTATSARHPDADEPGYGFRLAAEVIGAKPVVPKQPSR